jgi:predicted SnoaL-like aldol condensation-catalyzing enzyme
MVGGETEILDIERTEFNRAVIRSFVNNVLINGQYEKLDEFINRQEYTEHNPRFGDDLADFEEIVSNDNSGEKKPFKYDRCHRLLAEGNFVLSVCEGYANEIPSSFFDLYRLRAGKISEHWDTTESIPPRSEWKNNNGKF